MRFIYRGEFSKGLDSITNMGVTFTGREPAGVTDAAAIAWFDGHPDYVREAVEPAPAGPVKRYTPGLAKLEALRAKPAKKPKKPAKAKK